LNDTSRAGGAASLDVTIASKDIIPPAAALARWRICGDAARWTGGRGRRPFRLRQTTCCGSSPDSTDYVGTIVRLNTAGSAWFSRPRLLPWRSVIDNIRIAAPLRAERRRRASRRTRAAEHASHFPRELSLAQRVALARRRSRSTGPAAARRAAVPLDARWQWICAK
jgi:NitT/TauT family transport system ATP-binding protein